MPRPTRTSLTALAWVLGACVAAPAAARSAHAKPPVQAPAPKPVGNLWSLATTPADYDPTVTSFAYGLPTAGLRADGSLVEAPIYETNSHLRTWSVDSWQREPVVGIASTDAAGTDDFSWSDFVDGGSLVTGVDGADWGIAKSPRPEIPNDPNNHLVAIDDTGQVVHSALLPTGNDMSRVVATGHGVRVVTTFDDHVSVFDERARRIARLENFDPRSMIGRADGSVILAGPDPSAPKLPSPVRPETVFRRVSASGRVTVWHPGFAHHGDDLTLLGTVGSGVLYESTGSGDLPEPSLVLRTGKGRTIRRSVDHLGVARNPDCIARGQGFQIAEVAGPSGAPLVHLACVFDAGRDYAEVQSTLVGLDRQLRPRWTQPLPNYFSSADPNALPVVGPTGQLMSIRYEADNRTLSLTAFAAPDAARIPRGKVIGVGRDAHGVPYVRIRCDYAEGRVCNGTASLVAGHRVVATARYAMDARPGSKAAVEVRHFTDALHASGHLTARLGPVTS